MRRWLRTLAALAGATLVAVLAVPGQAFAETAGFWYGADSGGPGPANGSAPFTMPSCGSGHAYGGYLGKIGGADLVSASNGTGYGPGHTFAWVTADATDANTNHFSHNQGVGAGGYWFMFGPNNTDGTGKGAYAWGQQQATWALADWKRWYASGTHRMPLRVLWMDVEVPGSYGWSTTDHAANRQVFNGFWDTVNKSGDGLVPGVYSTQAQWNSIMAGHTSLSDTWEWTAQTSRASAPAPCPTSFSGGGISAVFFGGQGAGSAKAAIWQWSLGTNDYDQIDANKQLPD